MQQIRNFIREKSPYETNETERILAKFFSKEPRLVRILKKNHNFDAKKVLDIGSSYGQSLLHWGKGSAGFDVSEHFISFLQSLGQTVYTGNVEDGFSDVPSQHFEAVFTNNLLEHLVSPHLFLVRLRNVLASNGLLAIGHPVVPPWPINICWKTLGFSGWLASEHINFFTPATVKLFLERSGFQVVKQYSVSVHCLSVCRKVDTYSYPPRRLQEFDPSWAEDLQELR